MWKNLDENDGEGNPICSLETLHQGNSRQHSSCKDDRDRFEIPLFPLLDIGALRLPQISLPGTKESGGFSYRARSFDHNHIECRKSHLVDLSLLWTSTSGTYHFITCITDTVTELNPEVCDEGSPRKRNPCLYKLILSSALKITLKRAWRLIQSVNRGIKSGCACRRFYDLITRSSLWHNTLSREC